MELTRGELKSLAKSLLDEKGSLYWSDSLMNTIADEANRDVFRRVVNANGDQHLGTSTSFTFSGGNAFVDLESTLGKAVYKVQTLETTPESGAISATNLPTKMMPMRLSERSKFLASGGVQGLSVADGRSYHYALHASTLYIAPIPTQDIYIKLYYIPVLIPMNADSGTGSFPLRAGNAGTGRASIFHDAVYKRMAVLMNVKQNGNNPLVDKLWQEAVLHIAENAESRYADEPQSVRVLGHY